MQNPPRHERNLRLVKKDEEVTTLVKLSEWIFPLLMTFSLFLWYWTATRLVGSIYDEFAASLFVLFALLFLRSSDVAIKVRARKKIKQQTNFVILSDEELHETQLIDDAFAPAEAKDLLSNLIDNHINFYKDQYLNKVESPEPIPTNNLDTKIEELLDKKSKFKHLIAKSQQFGYRVSIKGAIELKLIR